MRPSRLRRWYWAAAPAAAARQPTRCTAQRRRAATRAARALAAPVAATNRLRAATPRPAPALARPAWAVHRRSATACSLQRTTRRTTPGSSLPSDRSAAVAAGPAPSPWRWTRRWRPQAVTAAAAAAATTPPRRLRCWGCCPTRLRRPLQRLRPRASSAPSRPPPTRAARAAATTAARAATATAPAQTRLVAWAAPRGRRAATRLRGAAGCRACPRLPPPQRQRMPCSKWLPWRRRRRRLRLSPFPAWPPLWRPAALRRWPSTLRSPLAPAAAAAPAAPTARATAPCAAALAMGCQTPRQGASSRATAWRAPRCRTTWRPMAGMGAAWCSSRRRTTATPTRCTATATTRTRHPPLLRLRRRSSRLARPPATPRRRRPV
ncbi:hypothetical protein Rsub_02972 [Raphidocelis subcapitata]|uniref:Uncharacterized protein n=1 Tax=Raphidocelis subcapitata TaxID=307507 RepID=A0A2V0NT07_9CHLO|nr:hypothetical protein Rsub_02972 [Raphidocelis subcapitata]|eukprot:GBF89802.1 hypothetical protein Rsub_02972 [Raphidocelis subcapitata]